MSLTEKGKSLPEEIRRDNSLPEKMAEEINVQRRVNLNEALERMTAGSEETVVFDCDGFVYTENMKESNRGQ